ncbi:MAG: 4Fe-4S dicluster domain-containing protein [Promethearchaeota archaeon]
MGRIKEKFVPVQINQELCVKCERCLRACNSKAIYFENSIRLIDYSKCKACLNCVQVCPRNAVEVTSIEFEDQVVSIKIDHEKCSMCEECLDDIGNFCPKNLFYKDTIKNKEYGEFEGIKFKFKEIAKCQGCLRCTAQCPGEAIKPVKFED